MHRQGSGDNNLLIVAAIGIGAVMLIAGAFAVGLGSNPGSATANDLGQKPADLSSAKLQPILATITTAIDSCAAIKKNEDKLAALSASLNNSGTYGTYIKGIVSDQAKRDNLQNLLTDAAAAVDKVIELGRQCVSTQSTVANDSKVAPLWATATQKIQTLQDALNKSLTGNYNFPGVEQGQHRYCQQAAAAMVALTYISNYGLNPVTQLDALTLPPVLQTALETSTNPANYPKTWGKYGNDPAKVKEAIAAHGSIAWFTTPLNPTSCPVGVVQAAGRFLNKVGAPVPNDWVLVGTESFGGVSPDLKLTADNRAKVMAAIKQSTSKTPPDPVVIDYTNVTACSYAHNIPLFFFNGTDFVTNNPGPGSIKYNQTKCGSKELNEANASQFVQVVIRKTYLQAAGLSL